MANNTIPVDFAFGKREDGAIGVSPVVAIATVIKIAAHGRA
ncbi:hypothetical protein CP97_14834 [Aurantiacibacter atlanticus]|uniref:Uncharacterized protein n=1 Tax=Aurantiacibacter atlanticus TaxID=1648404 RepID=A0A161IUE8_9SPHN|nr:hypothetical protein CP97_14834 [Aurantiacibacter atlanticus]